MTRPLTQAQAELLQQCQQVARSLCEHNVQLAKLLTQADRIGLLKALGKTRVEFAKMLGLSYEKSRCLSRLGSRFEELPKLEEAMRDGVGWTKLRCLEPILTADNVEGWMERARTESKAALAEAARNAKKGEQAPDGRVPLKSPLLRRLLRTLRAEDHEVVTRVLSLVRARCVQQGEDYDESAVIADIFRLALEREGVATEPTATVIVHICAECGVAHSPGRDVDESTVEAALDDCVVVDLVQSEQSAAVVDVIQGREPGSHAPSSAVRRSISPARRVEVLHRDGFACRVPGCRCDLWLHLHHLQPVSWGGGNQAENLVTLCSMHHRLLHDGRLGLEGSGEGALVVSTARGRRESRPVNGPGGLAEQGPLPIPGSVLSSVAALARRR